MTLTIATWNINSVRLRIGLVEQLLRERQPDVLCLQETKTPDEFFPHEAFEKLGYTHRHISGMKGYNGVAIVSRIPFASQLTHSRCGKEDCRHVVAALDRGDGDPIELHNIYVPAGGDIPDPQANVKFAHKLEFMTEIGDWFAACKPTKGQRKGKKRIIVGDLNIAPLEHDVWSHRQLLDVVSHTPVETDGLKRILQDGKFTDIARAKHPPEDKLYTWWSYRAADWQASNRGRRLDHIWADRHAAPLVDVASYAIHIMERGGEKPSDHVPVTVSVNLPG